MENNETWLTQFEAAAQAKGSNLHEICRIAGVAYTPLRKWLKEDPKTIKTMKALAKALDEIEEE